MDKKGFTLVELMVSLAVGMLIMLAVYGAMGMAQRSTTGVTSKVITQQDVRSVLDLMTMEIRMASYNPLNNSGTWSAASPLACMPNSATAPATYKGIKSATASSIAVAMDIGGSGVVGDTSNEYIVYSYDGDSTITRNVSCGGNDAILGGAGTNTNLRNAAAGISLFRYFDRSDVEIPATSLPARIPDIRRINITIVADTEHSDPNTQQPRRMIYSTNIIVRNHVLSP
ncbi:MAG: prepilin-type N-terminal cleavage/methylation domain-containing protein [Syntrophomonas sp.]